MSKQCELCEGTSNVFRRRIEIPPAFSKCVEVCRECMPFVNELLDAMRGKQNAN